MGLAKLPADAQSRFDAICLDAWNYPSYHMRYRCRWLAYTYSSGVRSWWSRRCRQHHSYRLCWYGYGFHIAILENLNATATKLFFWHCTLLVPCTRGQSPYSLTLNQHAGTIAAGQCPLDRHAMNLLYRSPWSSIPTWNLYFDFHGRLLNARDLWLYEIASCLYNQWVDQSNVTIDWAWSWNSTNWSLFVSCPLDCKGDISKHQKPRWRRALLHLARGTIRTLGEC